MKRFTTLAVVLALVGGIAVHVDRGLASEQEPEATDSDKVAQEVPQSLMRQKLDHAQKLLTALSIADWERMISNAEELQRISLEARWSQPHSPAYAEYGEDFRGALGRIVRSAEDRNVDGAALNYVQVVLTCVQCHKIVREGEQIVSNDDSATRRILEGLHGAGAE